MVLNWYITNAHHQKNTHFLISTVKRWIDEWQLTRKTTMLHKQSQIEPNRVTLYHTRCRWIFSKEFVQLPNIVCSICDSFSNRTVAISEPFHQISLQLSMININWQIACLYLMSAPAPFFISFVFFTFFLYLRSVSVLLPLLSTKSDFVVVFLEFWTVWNKSFLAAILSDYVCEFNNLFIQCTTISFIIEIYVNWSLTKQLAYWRVSKIHCTLLRTYPANHNRNNINDIVQITVVAWLHCGLKSCDKMPVEMPTFS